MTDTTKVHTLAQKSWLWPDHVIGKGESRALRQEHNAAVNEAAALLAQAEALAYALRDEHSGTASGCGACAALAAWDALNGGAK